MHLSLILTAIVIAWSIRCCGSSPSRVWADRWQQTLSLFLFVPLLLLMTALAVLLMGTQGQMLGLPVGWIGYSLAVGFLTYAGVSLLWLFGQGWRSLRQVQTYPAQQILGVSGRLLETTAAIAAQIGFWKPQLVVSQGLLDLLTPEQLDAVLTHEQAHYHYRDTFWFFWLGWARHLTAWLPQTEALWQELLLLRELRADRWAAQQVDALILAESLLLVVSAPLLDSEQYYAAFSAAAPANRLEERIEALIVPTEPPLPSHSFLSTWTWLTPSLLPLLTVLFHD
jgi:Zn-dependent protease with chaperone function